MEKLKLFMNSDFILKYSSTSYIKNYLLLLSLGAIFVYLYAFISNDGSIIAYTHDNFDIVTNIYKLLSDSNTFFVSNETIIPNIMNGLPRAIFPTEYNIVSMLYYLFSPSEAYLINEFLIRVIAFSGMFLLLKEHFFKSRHQTALDVYIIILGTALIFSLLPYWSNAGASIAGQPFVLYAFLNIRNKDFSIKNWMILGIYVFYSSLVLAGMFVLAMLVFITIYDWIKSKSFNYYLFIAIFGMSLLYLLVEYRLIMNMIDHVFVSHRVEFSGQHNDFISSLKRSAGLLINGQYHAHSMHGKFLLPFVFFSTFILLIPRKIIKHKALPIGILFIFLTLCFGSYCKEFGKYILLLLPVPVMFILYTRGQRNSFYLLGGILLISLFGGFYDYNGLKFLKENFSILREVQFDRFYFLFALLWFLLFALSSRALLNKMKYSIVIIVIMLLTQTAYMFKMQNGESHRDPISMNQFYSPKLFDTIKEYLNLSVKEYRIMHIGLHPSIGIYNGFYTLDAYMTTYPLRYKHEFRKIIAPQLNKSKKWTKYFDTWGNRCRLMDTSKDISLDLKQFKKMGGKYIFSSYKVNINNGENIKFLEKFSDKKSNYNIFLYEIK